MTERNQKIFRRILITLGIICVFLLGSVIRIPVSSGFILILISLTIGLTLGYVLGTGKDIRFWKNFKVEKKDDKK